MQHFRRVCLQATQTQIPGLDKMESFKQDLENMIYESVNL